MRGYSGFSSHKLIITRLSFYDPLYDFVTFEEAARKRPRAVFDAGFARSGAHKYGSSIAPLQDTKVILPFLDAVEFVRQSYLHQCNLAFLVYPSATHTRFAHAIGSCYLGFMASHSVAVADIRRGPDVSVSRYLAEFLEETGWREEFYLALLLHDIGHYPFSHALENNRDYWDGFAEVLAHEDAACQGILGHGNVHGAFQRRHAPLGRALRKSRPLLTEVFRSLPEIDRFAICYLISGRTEFIAKMPANRQFQLRLLHELISGLLDLDRIDHYRRDNFFTGLKSGTSVNYPGLLSGLTMARLGNLWVTVDVQRCD
jgi:HD superfamily phosphohydrolase